MKKKILLMGKSGSGKTTMRSIIFANYLASDTTRLGPTIDVEHSHVRFLTNLVLNLWDCGGQDRFMEGYFSSQRENIFSNVKVLIYLFDIESTDLEKDMDYYRSCREALLAFSPDAKVFCLIHKMDLLRETDRMAVFEQKSSQLREISEPLQIKCFDTSIWDETLYRAWSDITRSLIPNMEQLHGSIGEFCGICNADEVVVFERSTFLVICHRTMREFEDLHRFEKISNVIKHFKLSCNKIRRQFVSMRIQNSMFCAYLDNLTSNTCMMVIVSDPTITEAAILFNIASSRAHFSDVLNEVVADDV